MHRPRLRTLAVVAVYALAVSSCGGSDSGANSTSIDPDWVEYCSHATTLLTQSDISHSPDPAALKTAWETTGQLFAAMQKSAPLDVAGAVKVLAENWAARQKIFERFNYLVSEMAAVPEVSAELEALTTADDVVEANKTLSEITIRECGISE